MISDETSFGTLGRLKALAAEKPVDPASMNKVVIFKRILFWSKFWSNTFQYLCSNLQKRIELSFYFDTKSSIAYHNHFKYLSYYLLGYSFCFSLVILRLP